MKHFIVLIFAVASAIAQQSAVSNQKPAIAEKQGGAGASPTTEAAVPNEYVPSEVQKLKLENAQLKLVVVALQIQPLEQKRQEQLAALSELCQAIVKENHWPDNMKCDPATLKFKESQPRVAHAEPGSSTASRDSSTALQPKADRQPVATQPGSSADPRQ